MTKNIGLYHLYNAAPSNSGTIDLECSKNQYKCFHDLKRAVYDGTVFNYASITD